MAALIDVSEHAEAKLDGTHDFGVEGAESVFRLLQRDGAGHFASDAFLVGRRLKRRIWLEGEAGATIDFAVGGEDEGGGEELEELRCAGLVVLVGLIELAEVAGVGDEVVDSRCSAWACPAVRGWPSIASRRRRGPSAISTTLSFQR